MNIFKTLLIGAALAATLSACKKDSDDEAVVATPPAEQTAPASAVAGPAPAMPAAEISVSGVALGTVLGGDHNIVSPASMFAPTDTIYAAVATRNASSGATLAAKWMSEDGATVHEESMGIAPTADTVTDFQFKSASGLAPGKYKVEISLNGQPVQTLDFGIK